MQILFFVFANRLTGLGHFYRSLALARMAQVRGHHVYVASDRRPLYDLNHIYTPVCSPQYLSVALEMVKPDWLVVDLPHTLPHWIRGLTGCKICTLNGIGYDQNDFVDLRVIQGVAEMDLPKPEMGETVKGIEYVIIRPELEQYLNYERGDDLFVWGGAADNLGLLARFPIACPDLYGTLVMVDETPAPPMIGPNQAKVRVNVESTEIFEWMAGSRGACVAMGMVVYELIYLGLPVYCFNYSDLHLKFASALAEAGLIKNWPKVGLPDNESIRAFLEEPFEISGQGPDLDGAKRVLELMEAM